MAERIKDKEDLKLESMFRSDSVADDGFSVNIISRVKRQMWIRRLAMPVAIGIGMSIAAKPLLQLAGIAPNLFRDPRFVKAKGVLQDSELFDASLFGYSPAEVAFSVHDGQTGQAEALTLAGWTVGKGASLVRPWRLIESGRELARFDTEYPIARRSFFYLLRLLLPLVMIVLMAWGIFWIDQKVAGAQLRLASSAFLTLMAYQFVVAGLLPKVSYLTRMDRFLLGNTFLIFLTLVKAVLAERLVSGGRITLAGRVNLAGRWVYVGLFVLVTLVAFLL